MNQKKYYIKKNYSKAKYNCIYCLNYICYNKKKSFEKKCLGSNQCGLYQDSFKGRFVWTIKKYRQGFILIIQIPYISSKTFLDTSEGYVLNYRQFEPFYLSVNLKLFNIEPFNENTFNNFDKNIGFRNNTLSLSLYNPDEIVKIQDKSYSELKRNIVVTYSVENQLGKIYAKLQIPKDQLFRMFEKRFNSNDAISEVKIQEKENVSLESSQSVLESPKLSKKKVAHIPTYEYITAIVLNDVRHCTEKEHAVIDVKAKVKIAQPDAQIIDYWLPAAYCEECHKYYVLKEDFRIAKRRGIILCQIEDKTYDYISKHSQKSYVGGESRVHQMGYNVKKNNGLTRRQRQLILANMIENTDVTKQEIKSIIFRCICQHQAQENYSQSVSCWRDDLEFVNTYQLGDIPEVKLEKLIVKGQKNSEEQNDER